MSKLIKDFRIITTPGSPGTPGDPGSPGRPAYCYNVVETVLVVHPAPGGRFVYKTPHVGDPSSGWVWIPGSGKETIEYVQRTREVCLAAESPRPPSAGTPASPASTITDYNIGWNSGAVSAEIIPDNRGFFYKVSPDAVGIVSGLNRARDDEGYGGIDFGFRFGAGLWRVIEGGVSRTGGAPYTAASEFGIQRQNGSIIYTVDGEVAYTSAVRFTGRLIADASLYMAGDWIDNARFAALALPSTPGEISVSFRPLVVVAGDASGSVGVAFLPMEAEVRSEPSDVRVAFPPMTVFGGDARAGAVAVRFPPMVAEAAGLTGADLPLFALVLARFPGMTAQIFADAAYRKQSFPPMSVFSADHKAADVKVAMPPATVQAFDVFQFGGVVQLTAGRFSLRASATVGSPNAFRGRLPMRVQALAGARGRVLLPRPRLVASATVENRGRARLTLGPPELAMVGRVANVSGAQLRLFPRPAVSADGGAAARATLGGLRVQASGRAEGVGRATLRLPTPGLRSSGQEGNVARMVLTLPAPQLARVARAVLELRGLSLHFEASAHFTPTYEAYYVNLVSDDPERGGHEVTRWLAMPFLQVVRFRDRYYGVAADGIHQLGGDDDAGEPIAWQWQTGLSDFGAPEKKTPVSLLLGGRLGAQAAMRVVAGDDELQSYDYEQLRGETAQSHRQRFGRGIAGRYLGYGASDAQGGALHVESLTPEIAPHTRRT